MSSELHDQPLNDQRKDRILAIEPDPVRAETLQRLVREYINADFEIVKSGAEAMQSITERVPDLVLTSAFLPPAEEALLTDSLRQMESATHVQVITIPHFIDSDDRPVARTPRVLNFLRRRSAMLRPVCDPRTVRDQIEHYLERARNEKLDASGRKFWEELRTNALPRSGETMALTRRLTSEDIYTLANGVGPRTHKLGRLHAKDRRRASRRPLFDIPWLRSVRLPWGVEAGIVNISTSGVLLESSSKITPGSSIELQLLGHGTGVNMPARLIRSEVADVTRLGVKYRLAAAFERELDLGIEVAQQFSAASATPKALADLLVHVLSDVAIDSRSAVPRAKFEQGLRHLMPLREVQIRQVPATPNQQDESVYFKVPQETGSTAILQVIFERDHQPSPNEFKLLKAAAGVAGVVLEFSPL